MSSIYDQYMLGEILQPKFRKFKSSEDRGDRISKSKETYSPLFPYLDLNPSQNDYLNGPTNDADPRFFTI
jgi:hypothetical protein